MKMHFFKRIFVLFYVIYQTKGLKCVTCRTGLEMMDCIESFPPPQECALSTATRCNKIVSYREGHLESVMRFCTDATAIEECAEISGVNNVTVCQYFCDWDGCNHSLINRQNPPFIITMSTICLVFGSLLATFNN